MSSVQLNAGTPRGNNYHVENLTTRKLWQRRYKNGVMEPTYPKDTGKTLYSSLDYDIYYGQDLRDFHRRKASGELLPFTEYIKATSSISASGGFQSTQVSGANTYRNEYYFPGVDAPILNAATNGGGPFDTALLSLVDTWMLERGIVPSLYTQLSAAAIYGRGWDAGTFLAELHKIVSLVRGSVESFSILLGEFLQLFRKGHFGKADFSIAMLQLWLQGRYGWRILLFDIQDINKQLNNLDEKTIKRVKQRAGQTFKWTEDLSKTTEYGSSTQVYSDTRTVSISCRGSVIADIVPDSIILNPSLTAWELVPYSFVADWFFTIGQAISAISFIQLTTKYAAASAFKTKVVRQGDLAVTWKTGYSGRGTQSVTHTWEVIRRFPSTIEINPQFNTRLNIFKKLDLFSLVTLRLVPLFSQLADPSLKGAR